MNVVLVRDDMNSIDFRWFEWKNYFRLRSVWYERICVFFQRIEERKRVWEIDFKIRIRDECLIEMLDSC